ncbi:hypothetical protein [Legionella pneumophila]|uniref:hypothetical protein n=1 Tax=Legionella pneumophila TaxID=446 RepID=UPI00399D1A9A
MQTKIEQIGNKLLSTIPQSFLENLKELELPIEISQQLISKALLELSIKAEEKFGSLKEDELLDSKGFIEFMSQGFLKILNSIAIAASQLPPNIIAEGGVCEAVFSNSFDKKPIVATDSLATCVGIAGYHSKNNFGFVIHFATEQDLETSKLLLIEKITAMSSDTLTTPMELHIRGGVKGMSEPLVESIEKWVSENSTILQIKSKDVLQPFVNKLGYPSQMSISIDTRSGQVSEYDRTKNVYSKQKKDVANTEELDKLFSNIFTQVAAKKPGIEVVYFKPCTKQSKTEDVFPQDQFSQLRSNYLKKLALVDKEENLKEKFSKYSKLLKESNIPFFRQDELKTYLSNSQLQKLDINITL